VVHMRILVSFKLDVSNSFIFVVVFMVDSGIIFPGGWFCFSYFGGVGSECVIDKLLFHVGFNIKVTDRVDGCIFISCSCGLSPVLFYSRHMPLVDDGDNGFPGAVSVEWVKDVYVLLVYEYPFLVRCNLFKIFHKPVHSALIQTFSVRLSSVRVKYSVVIKKFWKPEFIFFLGVKNFSEKLKNVKSALSLKSLQTCLVYRQPP
jgi:hypothetical protein